MIRSAAVALIVVFSVEAQGGNGERVRFEAAPEGDPAFVARCAGHTTRLEATGATSSADGTTVHMKLVGANPRARAVALEPLESLSHYMVGQDEGSWRLNVQGFGQV